MYSLGYIAPADLHGSRDQVDGGVYIVTDRYSADSVLCGLEGKTVAIDSETYGCNPKEYSPAFKTTIYSWSVAFPWSIPGLYKRVFIPAWDEYSWTLEHFKPWLESDWPKVGANISWEVHSFANHGIKLGGVVGDIKHMSRLWYTSKTVSHGLKEQMSAILGYKIGSYKKLFSRPARVKDKTYKRSGNVSVRTGPLAGIPKYVEAGTYPVLSERDTEIIPLETLHTDYPQRLITFIDYGSLDSKGTGEVFEHRKKQLQSRIAKGKLSSWDIYSTTWQPAINVLATIERNGVSLDVGHTSQQLEKANSDAEEYKSQLNSWQPGVENWRSPDQLKELLFGKLNLPRPIVMGTLKAIHSSGKKFSTSEASLYWLETTTDCEELSILRKYRKTLRSARYLEDLPKFIASDGRIHTVLDASTDTGRLSSKLPALQQIPNNDIYQIRKGFVPRPGYKYVVLDYSQLEVYILAHMLLKLFNDSSIADALASGDVYIWIARECWPDELIGLSDAEIKEHARRKLAKIIVLSTNYGKTPLGLSFTLLDEFGRPAPEDYCAQLFDTYYNRVPGVINWQEWASNYARRYGGIHTVLGRWRPIPECRSNYAWERNEGNRKAMNTPIQGSAADIVMCAMLEIYRKLGNCIVLQIHDELVLEVPENEAEEILYRAKHIMENPPGIELMIPLKVVGKIANNWAEGK